MPNTDRHQPDFNQEPDDDAKKSSSISNDIDSLQSGIKIDFDQKLGELAGLLARFKALVVSPNGATNNKAANDDSSEVAPQKSTSTYEGTDNTETVTGAKTITSEDITDVAAFKPAAPTYFAETARFENGLYKLNSQLYRFRLELDQEMEFREEPLHTHFSQESELSAILQEISDRSSEKHSDN